MKHAKLVEDAKRDPMRIYSNPSDVLRDRRLSDPDRIAILKSWEAEMRLRAGEERLAEIIVAREEAERRLPAADTAA